MTYVFLVKFADFMDDSAKTIDSQCK